MTFAYSVPVQAAIAALTEFNSGVVSGGNPRGLGSGGHIANFPVALTDLATFANAVPAVADLMSGYADAAAASASDSANQSAKFAGTSVSSVSLSTGSKAFTTQSGKYFDVNRTLLVTSDANPTTHWMLIKVTSYSSTTLIGTVVLFAGAGSRADWTIGVTGYVGRAAGLSYLWSTDTNNSDPGTGTLKVNAGTLSSATAIYLSATDFDGNALSSLQDTWDDSTSSSRARVYIQQTSNPVNFLVLDITSIRTDNSGWGAFTVSYVTSGGTLTSGAMLSVMVVPKGDKGDTGAAGPTGSAGPTGAVGGAGFKFTFSTGTSGDPGAGKFRFDNATFASATKVALSETDADANGIGTFLTAIDDSTSTNKVLVVAIKQGGAAYVSFVVTSTLTDQGTYDEYNITPVSTSGSISNGDAFFVAFYLVGDKGSTGATGSTGSAGGGIAIPYTFSTTTTDADPGAGNLRLDNATQSSATKFRVDLLDSNGADWTTVIDAMDDSTNATIKGQARLFKTSDPTKFLQGNVSAVDSSSGYRNITVALTAFSGSTPFANADAVTLTFTRTGDKGTDGAGSGDVTHEGVATAAGTLVVWGADNQHIKGHASGAPGALAFKVTIDSAALLDNDVVTYAKIQNVSATDKLLGRSSSGAGDIEEVACTAAGRALIDDADAAAQRTTLSLGNVDNTSDASKPVSTAQQAAIDAARLRGMVWAATTANITIATALNNGDSLDGVTLATSDLVLVKDQSSAAENGIYVVGASPARSGEFDTYNEHPGTLIAVQEGTVNADTVWLCTSNKGGTINSTAIAFLRHTGPSTAAGTYGDATHSAQFTVDAVGRVTDAANVLISGGGGSGSIARTTKTANYTAALADKGNLIEAASGTWTLAFDAAATLGAGWWMYWFNNGTGNITLDPNSSETIDGLASFISYPGEMRLIECDGSNITSQPIKCGTATFTGSGTFTKPPGYTVFDVHVWSPGGGGGSGRRGAVASSRSGGGGGGGGAYAFASVEAANVGTTETVTMGAAGLAGSAQASNDSNGNTGGSGGNCAFGAHVKSYGGGGGIGGPSAGTLSGGAGGGVGGAASTSTAGAGASGFGGAAGGNGANGSPGGWGGAGGGGTSTSGSFDGGGGIKGGSGGGAGGNITSANVTVSGGGGGILTQSAGGGGAGGAAGGGATGTAGGALQQGGGGGGSGNTAGSTAGGTGGAGGRASGGGGGGASTNGANSGAGGAGGAGYCIVNCRC